MWGELAVSLQSGNSYIIAMMLFAFIATILIFERLIMMQFVYYIDFQKFLTNFRKMVASEDFERAMNFCKSVSKTSLPKIALKALQASENDPSSVRGTIEEETIEFLPRIEARLGGLQALATMVLLTGILGTIDQLWWAFHSIDVLDTAKKQASLANGIASALNPTAFGLMVCMLVLASYQFLRGLAIALVEHVNHGVAVLNNLLVPQDVAYVAQAQAPIAMSQELSGLPDIDNHEDRTPQQAADKGGAPEDDFADAQIEDIKDEEEII